MLSPVAYALPPIRTTHRKSARLHPDHFQTHGGVEINLMNELGIIDIDLHGLAGNTAKIIAHLNGVVAIMERSIGIGNGKFPTGRP